MANPDNYSRFTFEQLEPLWANLEAYAGSDRARANCIGLFAARLELGLDPDPSTP